MKCDKCGKEVKSNWRFCPKCGGPLNKNVKFSINLNDLFKKFFSQVQASDGSLQKVKKKKRRPRERRDFEETVEPSVNKKVRAGQTIYEIRVPGVNSMKDVEINVLEESVEVKAFAGKKLYFTTLSKEGQSLTRKKLRDDKLVLTIS